MNRVTIVILLATSACSLPVNGTEIVPAVDVVSDPVAIVRDSGVDSNSDAGKPITQPITQPIETPDAALACVAPPEADYHDTLPKACADVPAYWSSVNFILFASDGVCQISAAPDACACDYTCECLAKHPVAQPCTCYQTDAKIITLSCPSL